jgi:hypothetical protein
MEDARTLQADRVVTGAFNVINNISLQDALAKETKYSEPKFIYWKPTFEILMYSAEEHARQWTKREKENISGNLDLLRLDWFVMKNIA